MVFRKKSVWLWGIQWNSTVHGMHITWVLISGLWLSVRMGWVEYALYVCDYVWNREKHTERESERAYLYVVRSMLIKSYINNAPYLCKYSWNTCKQMNVLIFVFFCFFLLLLFRIEANAYIAIPWHQDMGPWVFHSFLHRSLALSRTLFLRVHFCEHFFAILIMHKCISNKIQNNK